MPFAAGLGALACPLRAGAGESGTVRAGGTTTVAGSLRLLAAAFAKAHPGSQVEISSIAGSAGGIGALLDGRIVIALTSRPPNEEERARAPLVSTEYARTPFVVAVHRNVGITALTSKELAALYGEGPVHFPNGERARPVVRINDAVASRLLKSISPEVAIALEAIGHRRGVLFASTEREAAALLQRTPGGFSVSTLATIQSERLPLVALTLDGRAPTLANLRSGGYPFHKSVHLVFRQDPGVAARRFLDFLRSEPAVRLLGDHGMWVIGP